MLNHVHDLPIGLQPNSVIGARIRALRMTVGVERDAMCARFGLSYSSLKKYENGVHMPSVEFVWALHNDELTKDLAPLLLLPAFDTTVFTLVAAMTAIRKGRIDFDAFQQHCENGVPNE